VEIIVLCFKQLTMPNPVLACVCRALHCV